jgi:hypothetical protein
MNYWVIDNLVNIVAKERALQARRKNNKADDEEP